MVFRVFVIKIFFQILSDFELALKSIFISLNIPINFVQPKQRTSLLHCILLTRNEHEARSVSCALAYCLLALTYAIEFNSNQTKNTQQNHENWNFFLKCNFADS